MSTFPVIPNPVNVTSAPGYDFVNPGGPNYNCSVMEFNGLLGLLNSYHISPTGGPAGKVDNSLQPVICRHPSQGGTGFNSTVQETPVYLQVEPDGDIAFQLGEDWGIDINVPVDLRAQLRCTAGSPSFTNPAVPVNMGWFEACLKNLAPDVQQLAAFLATLFTFDNQGKGITFDRGAFIAAVTAKAASHPGKKKK